MLILNGQPVEIKRFPNGESHIRFDEVAHLLRSTNIISFKYETDASLIELMLLKDAIDNEVGDSKVNELIIVYMPYSRMDRRNPSSSFSLRAITKFINSLNFDHIMIHQAHSDVCVGMLENAASFPTCKNILSKIDVDASHIYFPDAGAQKNFADVTGYEQLVGFKHRDFGTGKIIGLQVCGEVPIEPFNVILMDDLIAKGTTMLKSVEQLKGMGADKVWAIAAHTEDTIFQGELLDHIDMLFTTDSILTKEHEKIKVFPVLR